LGGDQQSAGSEIALATLDDVAGILDLQEKNLRENGGTLSERFSHEWFEAALGDLPVIVARRGGRVVGYLMSSSTAAQAQVPIVQATLKADPRSPGAYPYGPICIAETEQGQNLPVALMTDLRARLPDREGITFIRRDTVASLRAHAKFGTCEAAGFDHDGVAVVVVAQRG
jgi:hypothetical protein